MFIAIYLQCAFHLLQLCLFLRSFCQHVDFLLQMLKELGGMSAIRMHQPVLILLMPYVFLNIHLSYGFGYLTGSFNVMRKKTTRVTSNR